MTNNDILRQLRYVLNINDLKMIEIFKLADYEIGKDGLAGMLRKEGEEGLVVCSDAVLGRFLDGLILYKRGRRETKPGETRKPELRLTNNDILKKIEYFIMPSRVISDKMAYSKNKISEWYAKI